MEVNLPECFFHTLSQAPGPRCAAEARLREASEQPNYAIAVLRLIARPDLDEQIRHAVAVNFKNHLRSRWALIAADEKHEIKTFMVTLTLSFTPAIQSQLIESLSLICKHDFPNSWPTLLPDLVHNLNIALCTHNWDSINTILGMANSIFKRFRYHYQTNDLLLDLKYCLDTFCPPLLGVFLKTAAKLDSLVISGGPTLNYIFESLRLCCRIFYSLNFQELPEFFEDHMDEWMAGFQKFLTTSYPSLEVVDDLRAAVCENISLYLEKNEEEFKSHVGGFTCAILALLGNISQSSSRDRLTVTAIKFLTLVSTGVHHPLLATYGAIPQICQSIVIPNVRLRDDDEELFEMNYIEFIRRDMEGSDLDTRRRIACELLKGVASKYRVQVTELVAVQVQNLLSSYAANPVSNWKDKDCAIYLVVSLATKKAGGSYVSSNLVDVQNFFLQAILPELQSQDVNGFPLLKAGALKFLTVFRSLIPKLLVVQLLPDLVRFLGSESNVVHSYAASCIEKMLLVKDEGGRPRYTSADVAPFFPVLMNKLFNALKFPESEENQYIMKCIMRVLGVAELSPGIPEPCIAELASSLNEVCKNPKNPIFNHYLFEAVAILVRRGCEWDASLATTFEKSLFPILEMILANDVTEFFPYAFQLFALLVELSRPPISSGYMTIFARLLKPDAWKRNSDVPAFVRFLQAILQKIPHELNQKGTLSQVLGVFSNLVQSPSTDEHGFYVLNTVIENLEYGILEPYIASIWIVLFRRLENNLTTKFVKSMLISMSLFLVKHGPGNLVDTMNTVQPGMFLMILEQFWIPNLKLIAGRIEGKLAAVASTKLICESPSLLDTRAAKDWGKTLDSIVTLLCRPEDDRVEEEQEMPDITENVGYTATFVNLYNAGKKEVDPLKDIKDPKEFLAVSLAKLSTCSPWRFPQIISASLEPANQTALLQLCNTYHCPIV
ncbi:Exportin-2 [Euphorbia peplus]|nr:Exportin-2 [Euphorbia peplus]